MQYASIVFGGNEAGVMAGDTLDYRCSTCRERVLVCSHSSELLKHYGAFRALLILLQHDITSSTVSKQSPPPASSKRETAHRASTALAAILATISVSTKDEKAGRSGAPYVRENCLCSPVGPWLAV